MKQVLRTSLVPVAAALALALAAAPLFAAGPAPGPKGPLAGYLHCLGVAGLTDVQKADVKALLEAARPGTEALLATLKSDREALHAAVTAATPDACAVGTALLKVEADLKAIGEEGKALRTAIEALLTPEQKLKLEGCLKAPRPHGAEDEPEEI
jgi:Spy/CpxP family protein refolding chaperone